MGLEGVSSVLVAREVSSVASWVEGTYGGDEECVCMDGSGLRRTAGEGRHWTFEMGLVQERTVEEAIRQDNLRALEIFWGALVRYYRRWQ